MKTITHPTTGAVIKFGRNRPKPGKKMLHMAKYADLSQLPAPKINTNYAAAAAPSLSNIFMNDSLGCCVIAGYYHVKGVETGNAGSIFIPSNDQIVQQYSAIGGYVPGNESTDNGCDEQSALDYWCGTGDVAGTKIQGYVSVDATNVNEIQQACFLFENLYFGLELPDAYVSPFPSAPGFVWDVGTPDANNGHCIMGTDCTDQGVNICTWGLQGTMTYAAIAQLCVEDAGGQLYSIFTPDQLAKAQTKAPNGFDWATLQADLAALQYESRGGITP